MSAEYSFPRPILKWLQGLNLSQPPRDLRRDLLNGYTVAEIVLLYHKNALNLHSFANSHNTAAKQDNWTQLERVFQKLSFATKRLEFEKIQVGDLNQLALFMAKLHKFLTGKGVEVLPKRQLVQGKTKTFLLTETGLENINLQNKKLTTEYKLLDKNLSAKDLPNSPETFGPPKPAFNPNKTAGSELNPDFAISKTDLLQMLESNDRGADNKSSVASMKNMGSRKDLNFIMRNMEKSRAFKGSGNIESRFSGRRELNRTTLRDIPDPARRHRRARPGAAGVQASARAAQRLYPALPATAGGTGGPPAPREQPALL